MDLASLIGVIAGVGLVLASILMNSGLDLFINIPSAMIVIGGTLAATLIAFPINEVMKVMGLFLRVFMVKKSDQYALIESMVGICNVARKGGVLAIESKLKDKHIQFMRDFDPAPGEFEIDAGRLHSALLNILENAIDACTKDTSKQKHKIILGIKKDKKNIIFHVHDNGIGMDKKTREKLFTLFFSSKGSKGTGLGLFIADKIIRQHGGSIHVESTPGRGAHLVVRIPKILPESAKIAPIEPN